MALIVLTSANGSPGVTTAALGLAMSWPRPVVLVDADPTGAMAIPAGYLRGAEVPPGHSVVDLGLAQRGGTLAEALPNALLDLPGTQVKLLTGPAKHNQARLLEPLWEPLAVILKQLERTGQDAIVDMGRLGLEGSPQRLLAAADLCLLTLRSHLPAVIAASSWTQTLKDTFARAGAPASLGLLVIQPDNPYSAANVGKALDLRVVSSLPWDPANAAHLSYGANATAKGLFRRGGGLSRGLLGTVEAVHAHLAATRAELSFGPHERITTPHE